MEFHVKPLSPETWDDFEALARRHNGVWGGCWCTWFHQCDTVVRGSAEDNRKLKRSLVAQGRAHAALVYDGNKPIAWCQYGSPEELPNIYHKKEVEADGYQPPDYRITCFFVDTEYRRKGAAKAALLGALDLIARAGGGTVEGYPQDTQGKRISASFLYNGTKTLFETCGFTFLKSKGKNHTVMRRFVDGA
ncbi:MAG TPA: GNAT family N-acetyltransferase [Candidatus Limiplasma sp.]|nr:GNAT family N-acetyltransferase [Candidatus Limiplasma sp.]HRX08627.1 GNAT family N-acetyltransferase [Candidatus Limiplasma sp.]